MNLNRLNPILRLFLSAVILFGLIVSGIGVMVYLSPYPADQITPARDRLLDIADWAVKASVGAILGIVGGSAASSNGRGGE